MSPRYLALVALALPLAARGQTALEQAFRDWARDHVHPAASMPESRDDADMRSLGAMVGPASVVAFGEPVHGGHEPLAMRNRLIRHGVTRLGFTAVALETCLSSSKRLYDHVLGRTIETDAALKDAFCYGFGDYPENLELLRWLRSYNAGQPPDRKVRLYGIDLSGQYSPSAYLSLEAVLDLTRSRRSCAWARDAKPVCRSNSEFPGRQVPETDGNREGVLHRQDSGPDRACSARANPADGGYVE